MNELEKKIAERITREGPLTFETYMEMALYEPGMGYYASPDFQIGRAGDFYTSQHVHSAFGSMIGKQLEEMWEAMDRPSVFYAIEPGAGAGLTCLDILNFLKDSPLFSSLTYVIVEKNPCIRKKQEQLLSAHVSKVRWTSSLAEIGPVRGCILSNELLDAFPVHVIEMDGGLNEIYVDLFSGADGAEGEDNPRGLFIESKMQLSNTALADYLAEYSIDLPVPYRTEINLKIKDWLREVAETLAEGFMLTIDYGYPAGDYYSPERNRGTLLCYHKHQLNEDPYQNVGEQDITAHVNFSSVKKWGEELGFRALGFCTQGNYLISLGIDQIISGLYRTSPDYLFEIAKIKRLIFPGTLGQSHKVMVQYKGKKAPELSGFTMKNQTGIL